MHGDRPGLRRFAWAAVLGSLLAWLIDAALLVNGHAGLTGSPGVAGTLLDVQARAMLGGHFSVPPAAAGIEGFVTDGKTYLYFGPVLSLLHAPFLAIGGHGVDGHLTQLSMLLGYAVLLAGGGVLHWRIRDLLRGDEAVGRTDVAAGFLFQLGLGAGAVPLYLASWTAVYHEVELWGAAFTVAALAALVGVLRRPSVRGAVWVAVFATLAVNTRLSVGMAAVAAAGLVALALLCDALTGRLSGRGWRGPAAVSAFVARFGPRAAPGRRRWIAGVLLAAVVVPLAISIAINQVKFGQPLSLPLDRQAVSHIDPNRIAALAANPEGLFGAKFVPTSLLQYVRPDAVGLARGFPWVSTPAHPPTVIGDVHFDTLEPSLSAPTSMPLLCLLALVALVGLWRPVRRRPLWGVFVVSSLGLVTGLTLAYVTTRYLTDLLPCLLVGGAAGLQLLVGRVCRAGAPARRWVLVGVAGLLALGFLVDGSTGLLHQQLLRPDDPPAARAAFVRHQDDVDRFLGRSPHGLHAVAELPRKPTGRPGDLYVVGRCAGLYVVPLTGTWLAVERTAGTGLHELSVTYPTTTDGRWETLATLGAGPTRSVVLVRATPATVQVAVRSAGHTLGVGPHHVVPRGVPVPTRISLERLFSGPYSEVVTIGGHDVIVAPGPSAISPGLVAGRDPRPGGYPPFSGTVRVLPTGAPVCRTLVRRAGRAI
jgi:hypothetical protein